MNGARFSRAMSRPLSQPMNIPTISPRTMMTQTFGYM